MCKAKNLYAYNSNSPAPKQSRCKVVAQVVSPEDIKTAAEMKYKMQ